MENEYQTPNQEVDYTLADTKEYNMSEILLRKEKIETQPGPGSYDFVRVTEIKGDTE